MASQEVPTVFEDVSEAFRTNCVGFASFTILIWDHIDTFPIEVEYIWQKRKGMIGTLFLINRYLTPLGFMVNLFAYLSPVWDFDTCQHFVRFEGSMTLIGIGIVALMMFLRIKALYHDNRWVKGIVLALFMVVILVNAWLLTKGEGVVHNQSSGVHACTMIFDPSLSVIASSSAWLPLLYDTVILTLTMNRTLPAVRRKGATFIMKRIFEDGLMYYTAIFSVTLVLTLMIIFAPPGLKNITAQLELLITVTMMSRITLNLKKSTHSLMQSVPPNSQMLRFDRGFKPPTNGTVSIHVEMTTMRHDVEEAHGQLSTFQNDPLGSIIRISAPDRNESLYTGSKEASSMSDHSRSPLVYPPASSHSPTPDTLGEDDIFVTNRPTQGHAHTKSLPGSSGAGP